MDQHTTTPACVLFTPPGCDADPHLQGELERRDWAFISIDDPYLALAELCIRHHGEQTHDEWGLARHQPPRLLAVAPERSTFARSWRDLREAARAYAPTAEVWTYRDRELTLESPAALPPESEIVPDRSSAREAPAPPRSVEVTAEEIAMLLDRPDEDDQP